MYCVVVAYHNNEDVSEHQILRNTPLKMSNL